MERFQFWLYHQKLFDEGETIGNDLRYRFIYELWIFGDMRGIPQLQNIVIDTIIFGQRTGGCAFNSSLQYAFDNTVVDSPLVRVLLHGICRGYRHLDWKTFIKKDDLEWASKELLAELVGGLIREIYEKKLIPSSENRCDYHVHAKDEPRCIGKDPLYDK